MVKKQYIYSQLIEKKINTYLKKNEAYGLKLDFTAEIREVYRLAYVTCFVPIYRINGAKTKYFRDVIPANRSGR